MSNAGEISGYVSGIYLLSGGAVTNQSGGSITGSNRDGVQFVFGAGTVVNAGSIAGATDSVRLVAGYANRLVIDPRAVFSGTVDGGNTIGTTIVSTLELASGASIGTLSGIGSQYINFAAITIDSGADWMLTGSNDFASGVVLSDAGTLTAASLIGAGSATIQAGATLDVQGIITGGETIAFGGAGGLLALGTPGSISGAVTGFVAADAIDLAGVDPASVQYASGELDFVSGGTAASFALAVSGGAVSAVTDNNGGALVSALCFCAGTRIMTPSGEVAVEALSVGDVVLTASGDVKPIVWIGIGVVLATRGQRSAATPVIVRKGALADNVPTHDLRVTKGHALYLDSALIPVELLVNHRSIEWDDRAQEVKLYHIELNTHDVLIANGAPAESYRDDGNRWLFQNANTGWDLPPQEPFAPILTGGPIVDDAWQRLTERAGARPGLPLTDDPDLHLLVDGQRVNAIIRAGEAYVFRLARPPAEVHIISRAAAAQELGTARDPRVLGVAVRRIVMREGRRLRMIEAEDTALDIGFHLFEPDNEFRWTDGDALVPAALFADVYGVCELELEVGCTARYVADTAAA